MNSAVNYISQHAPSVKSVYVRAMATYALTLHDSSSVVVSTLLRSLEELALEKGRNLLRTQPHHHDITMTSSQRDPAPRSPRCRPLLAGA